MSIDIEQLREQKRQVALKSLQLLGGALDLLLPSNYDYSEKTRLEREALDFVAKLQSYIEGIGALIDFCEEIRALLEDGENNGKKN